VRPGGGLNVSSRDLVNCAKQLGIKVNRAAALLSLSQEIKLREAVASGFVRRRWEKPASLLPPPVPAARKTSDDRADRCVCCDMLFRHKLEESWEVCKSCASHYRQDDEPTTRTIARLADHETRTRRLLVQYREMNNELETKVNEAYAKRDKWMQALVEVVLAHAPDEDGDGCVCGAEQYPCVTRRQLRQVNRGIFNRIEELERMPSAMPTSA
jgi:hypothetical protein